MLNRKTFVVIFALVAAAAFPSFAQEAKLIAVLKSGASLDEKSAACRQLARIASKESVPALAALLGDEKLSHMARYALETIPDPSVDEALRDALPKLKGRPLLGVIGSIGVRRDGKAIGALAGLLSAADSETSRAAAHALGNIGERVAAQALAVALIGESRNVTRLAICEGLLRCAEALQAKGESAQAQTFYDHLRALKHLPPQIRAAALRGAILTRGKAGIPLLIEAVRGPDYAQTAAAARTAMELSGSEITVVLSAELPKLSADKQVLVINTLGYRGDATAGPALLALAKSQAPQAVRLAAVNNLTHLAYTPALPLLAELSLTAAGDLAAAARTCLGNFPGREADAAIEAMLGDRDAKVRSLAIQLVGQRNIAGSAASLLKAADDSEEIVRQAAFKALHQQASAADLPGVLNLLTKARSAADVQAVESVLLAICVRESRPAGKNIVIIKAEYGDFSSGLSANVSEKVAALVKTGTLSIEATNDNFGEPAQGRVKQLRVDYSVNGLKNSIAVTEGETLTFTAVSTAPTIIDAICEALPGARGEARLALLRSLRTAGGPKSLEVIRAAAADRDAQVKDTAQHILCDWPTPDALPLIVDLAAAAPTKSIKVLALRGLVRLLPQVDLPVAKRFETLKEAMSLADRNEERQLVLSALGNTPSEDALALVASYLDNSVLREEACIAAVAIAEKIAASHNAKVASVLRQVATLTTSKDLAARAKALAGAK